MAEDTASMVLNKAENADKQVETTYEKFVSDVDSLKNQAKDMKTKLKDMKKSVDEADAEKMAADATNQTGVVSVADALKMIDAQKQAEEEYRKASSQYLASAAKSVGAAISSGVQVLGMSMVDAGEGIGASLSSKTGISALGAGVVAAMLPDAISSPAAKMMEGIFKLEDQNDTDVDPKYIDGYETPDNAAKSAIYDNTANPPGGANGGVGADSTEDKEVPLTGDDYIPTTQNDATTLTGEELDKMSKLEGISGKVTKIADRMANGEGLLTAAISVGAEALFTSDKGKEIAAKVAGSDKDKENDKDNDYEFDY